ncbi:MAG: type 4a pilus biogenesis protein PilO [Candidatus Cloacimonetes bacterium]|nr:type 4a pilus biogenesis protein PilO [Candidatus Cloacimonadota bacterium]
MDTKQKYLILLLVMAVIAAGFFYFSSSTIQKKTHKIKLYDAAIKKNQAKLNSAKVLNDQLKEMSKVIMNSMTKERKFSSSEVNALIKELADVADKYQISVHGMIPQAGDSFHTTYVEQKITLDLNCTYVQLGKFLTDMESIDQIIHVRTLDVRPVESKSDKNSDAATRYRITLELSVYKVKKEA